MNQQDLTERRSAWASTLNEHRFYSLISLKMILRRGLAK